MSNQDGKVADEPAAPARPDAEPATPEPGGTRTTSSGTVLLPPAPSRTSGGGAGPSPQRASAAPERTSQGTVLMRPTAPGARRSRTTIMEVSEVARRLSMHPRTATGQPDPVRQMVFSFVVSITIVTLAAMMFAGGAWRLVLGIFAAIGGTTLAVSYALRLLPALAKRIGERELPGTPVLWIGSVIALVVVVTTGLTWGVSEATRPLAKIVFFGVPAPSAAAPEPSADAPKAGRADAKMKRGTHVMMDDGLLFVPSGFHSEDGRFDVLIHYHGNPEIIERSMEIAGLNAVAHIINLGDGSGKYSEPLRNPQAFDIALERIEQRVGDKFGLSSPRIRRVALSSWSAGFGAVYHILTSRSRLDRIDALLMMDSLHASFAPGSETKLADISLHPFAQFAKRAVAGEKLMILTHSAIETHGYPDTTRSADGLLERLNLERRPANPDTDSPPPVDDEAILKTFPPDERSWLRVTSKVEAGSLLVLGCKGKGKGDHIAHLAQISVTMFPRLVARWSAGASN